MAREDRKKASDVFADSRPIFGQKVGFAEAFPTIESLRVRYRETGAGVHQHGDGWSTRSSDHLGEFVNCSNSLCYNGGFSIGHVIREMVRGSLTTRSGHASCQGYEGSPKGKRRYRSCFNQFEYTVEITYKPSP